jgi:acyl carrier protein
MVEELNLERVYAQRGIDLITPAVGARILDRLINQQTANVVAISADWSRARHAFGARPPMMFSELGKADPLSAEAESDGSVIMALAATPEADRPAVISDHLRQIVATVFDCGVDDFEPDDMLEDIGLDSMMAMEFRVRINMVFSIDLPVLEILRGVSVNSLADRILTELHSIHGDAPTDATEESAAPPPALDDELDRLMGELSEDDLRALLAELGEQTQSQAGEAHS